MSDTNGTEAAPSLEYFTPDDGFSDPTSDNSAANDEALETDGDDTGDEQDPDLELDLDEAELTGDETAEELEEIERNGKKAKIPAWLKPELMMQADYTRKTQEVAAVRKELDTNFAALEQQRQAIAQQAEFQQANLQEFAKLVTLNDQLTQYEQVDWEAYESQDPFAAQAAWRAYQQLEKSRNNLAGNLQQKHYQAEQERQRRTIEAQQRQQADTAKQIDETMVVLKGKIPGWNEKLATDVSEYAMKAAGYTFEELKKAVGDPRAFVLLHKAMKHDQIIARSAERAKAKQPEAITPLTPVARGRASPAPVGLDDRLGADEWVKRRNEQLRGRGR